MKWYRLIVAIASLSLTTPNIFFAQENESPENWFQLDAENDGFPGLSTGITYEQLLSNQTSVPVIVAVLDGGVDVLHEDLTGRIWVNEDEVPDNGIDDDHNGYIDDIHGWNFLGNATEDIRYDNLEFTRVYKKLKDRFESKKKEDCTPNEKVDFEAYAKMKPQFENRLKKAEDEANKFLYIADFYSKSLKTIAESLGVETGHLNSDLVAKYEPTDDMTNAMKELVVMGLEQDFSSELEEGRRHYISLLEYSYNLEYDSRAIIGDNPNLLDEKGYGNNHVIGPGPDHGTHVAGIIGAERNNDVGVDGIAGKVQIMVLRMVPDGDEHDKDIANAIKYAVDNGARVINMSFGKSYSPNKNYVDKAVAYAESKGVLLVHAAGNAGKNIDKSDNFPNANYLDGKRCSTWIEVGASSYEVGPNLVADFSNYSKKSVDVFAPGVSIYSTLPDNSYGRNDGTSMAAPMVSGVAALLMSFFPELSAKEVKDIIEDSGVTYKKLKVVVPGHPLKRTKLKKISRTGTVVNVFQAVQMALEVK